MNINHLMRAFDKEKNIIVCDFDQTVKKHYPEMQWGDSIHSKVWNIGVRDSTLMLCTGKLDFNGTRIYESDIVRDHNGVGVVEYVPQKAAFRVNYHNGEAEWFIDYVLQGEAQYICVLGNIHLNGSILSERG